MCAIVIDPVVIGSKKIGSQSEPMIRTFGLQFMVRASFDVLKPRRDLGDNEILPNLQFCPESLGVP